MDTVRIDKWLWAGRFFKTRGLATEAVTGGRVHVNGARVKPAKDVRVGDTIQIRVGVTEWTVKVVELSERRRSAPVAQGLYEETDESRASRERLALQRKAAPPPLGADLGARPTKQDRRRLEALRKGRRGYG